MIDLHQERLLRMWHQIRMQYSIPCLVMADMQDFAVQQNDLRRSENKLTQVQKVNQLCKRFP